VQGNLELQPVLSLWLELRRSWFLMSTAKRQKNLFAKGMRMDLPKLFAGAGRLA